MKRPLDASRLRPRFARKATLDSLHDEGGHLWAVSYSDLLMVLMSFFVIFFSFGKDEKNSRPLIQISSLIGASRVPATAAPTESKDGGDQISAVVTRLADPALGLQAVVARDGDSLTVRFPNDAFASGAAHIRRELRSEIERVGAILKSAGSDIDVIVVGHADARPLKARNEFLRDNFDLSVRRAIVALRSLEKAGFPGDRLFAQGSSSNERSERSISLVIREHVKPGGAQ